MSARRDHSTKADKRVAFSIVIIATLLITLYFLLAVDDSPDWNNGLSFLLESDKHPVLFCGLLVILPLFGFPITIFCFASGAKFGVIGGTFAIGAAMGIHLLIAYWVGHSYLRDSLIRWLQKRGHKMPEAQQQYQLAYTTAFVAIPVIPYAAKNYLLAISNLSITRYFVVAWSIQMLYSFPLIATTGSVHDRNHVVLVLALIGLALMLVVSHWAKRRLKK